jgi:hypothetical protein
LIVSSSQGLLKKRSIAMPRLRLPTGRGVLGYWNHG